MLNAEVMLKAAVAALLVAAVTAAAQQFAVGTIDFYGLGDIRVQDARRTLTVKEGDVVSFEGERPRLIAESERNLAELPGVRAGHVHVVCCEAGTVMIACAPRKDDVVGDLARAVRDPSEGVRNNAMRALGVFAAAAPPARPKSAIPVDGFVGLLNSPVWTDRNTASLALLRLTESRDAALLARLRREALPSLVDMARWKAPGATILGRMAGLSEEKIAAATATLEGRETIVAAVTAR